MSKIPGTLIFHLPFIRSEYIPPQITLVIRKRKHWSGNVLSAGISICSRTDQFSRKVGVTKANGNLNSRKAIHSFKVIEFIQLIQTRLAQVNGIHGNITADVFADLLSLENQLDNMKGTI